MTGRHPLTADTPTTRRVGKRRKVYGPPSPPPSPPPSSPLPDSGSQIPRPTGFPSSIAGSIVPVANTAQDAPAFTNTSQDGSQIFDWANSLPPPDLGLIQLCENAPTTPPSLQRQPTLDSTFPKSVRDFGEKRSGRKRDHWVLRATLPTAHIPFWFEREASLVALSSYLSLKSPSCSLKTLTSIWMAFRLL